MRSWPGILERSSSSAWFPDEDEILLRSYARPIVLLRKRANIQIAEAVAPGQRHLGLMLPYTPLHHLLLAEADVPAGDDQRKF